MLLHRPVNRRRLLQRIMVGAASVTVARQLLPAPATAAPALVDPYAGSIPLIAPLRSGTYQTPVGDNWHVSRQGRLYPWNHRNSKVARAHDGVDLYPSAGRPLPTVYAPLAGTVAAVCVRAENSLTAQVSYRASATTPPPWDYSSAIDSAANLPLYGNFVWLRSTDPTSAGYFIFLCHLQNEPTIRALIPDQPVSATTPLGLLGDTGNATGAPQLHIEIHYPADSSFGCRSCAPRKSLTNINPYASLRNAAMRD